MNIHIPTNFTPLSGHTSFETAFEVKDYPYGGYRTAMRYWVETKLKHGQRLVTCSLNPKTGRWNKPHAGIYSRVICLYINNDNGHCEHSVLYTWQSKNEFDLFEKAFAAVLTDEQKKDLRALRALNKLQSPKYYFGLTDEQEVEYKAALDKMWADYPDKENPEQKEKRNLFRAALENSIVNQLAAG